MPQLASDAMIAGRYRLNTRLDAGGRAQVWSATDVELSRPVAVKILLTPTGGDPSFVAAFRAEAQLEARLKHPAIVDVLDWGQDESANYVVYELLEGRTVSQLLASGLIPQDRAIASGRQVASALVYAHAEGAAHGSISPAHVIVDPDGRTTLIDFGLQCRGACEYPATADADTFAAGALLYEMVTGVSPTGPRPVNVSDAMPWPAHPHKLVDGVSTEFDHVIMKAIAPDPGERYRTAAELQEALDALSRPKSRTGLWVTLALVAVALAVAGTWLFTSQQNIVVPDVAGQSQADAESVLTAAGLKMVVAGQAASTSVAAGDVVSEDPPAGARVRRGAQIGVMVSTGKPSADVPSVTGLDLQTASSHLTAAGFAVGQVTTQTSTAIPDGSVISQSPAAGTNLTAGTAIDLVVSAAQVKVTVPVVTGTTQSDATTALEQLGFVVDITKAFSDQPKGEVVRQAPAAGSSAPQGSTVTLEISKGVAPVKVPDLTGAQESDAKTSLQNLGLVPVSVPTSGTPSQVGTVISQDPGAGTKVAPGSQVKIDIGK